MGHLLTSHYPIQAFLYFNLIQLLTRPRPSPFSHEAPPGLDLVMMAFIEAQIARKKVLENPFNASHWNPGGGPSWVQTQSVPEIKAELKRRGLSGKGVRSEIVARLKQHNLWVESPAGIRQIHHRKLDVIKQQALAEVVPFDCFRRLPIEIRLIIWKFSLPGPRALNISDVNHDTEKLHFRKDDNYANPAALSTCHESRTVALNHYRLCFGTPNIYADLAGGDILHFGQSYTHRILGSSSTFLNWMKWSNTSGDWIYQELNKTVVADLHQVANVSICQNEWDLDQLWDSSDGVRLRQNIKHTFPGLKQLMLVGGGSESSLSSYNATPGHITLKELPQQSPSIWNSDDYGPRAYKLRKDFLEKNLSEKEKEEGVPDVQVVAAYRVTDIPGDDWQRDKGEPFVSINACSSRCLLTIVAVPP